MKKYFSLIVSLLILMTSLNLTVMAAPVVDADTGVITIDAVADREATSTVAWYKDGASATENALAWQNAGDTYAEYKVNVEEAGLYEFSAYASGQYKDNWNFAYVTVNDKEQIVQGANSVIQYPKAAGWINVTKDSNFDWYTPGFVKLSKGENTIKVKIRTVNGQLVFLTKLKLTPVSADTTEMVDNNGKVTVPINKLSNYTGTASVESTNSDYLAYRAKSDGCVISFDVYTQKPGRYMLSGDMYFGEYEGYGFYYADVSVNGESVYTGTSSNPIATETDPGKARATKDACEVRLNQGKNTISVKIMSDRNKNWIRLFAFYLNEYMPQFEIVPGEKLTVDANVNKAKEYNTEVNNNYPLTRGNISSSATYRVIVPEGAAGNYEVTYSFLVVQNDISFNNKIGYVATVDGTAYEVSVVEPASATERDYVASWNDPYTLSGVIPLKEGINDVVISMPFSTSHAVQVLKSISLVSYRPFVSSFTLNSTAFNNGDVVTATATIDDASKAPADADVLILIAKYDVNGRMISAELDKWNGTDASFDVSITADSLTDEIRAFLWTDDLVPLKTVPAVKKKQQ